MNNENKDLKIQLVNKFFDNKISLIDDDVDESIYEISKGEIDEQYQELQNIIENVSGINNNLELKRLLHTIKGTLRMTGFNKAGAVSHRLESIIEYLEVNSLQLEDNLSLLKDELERIGFLYKNKSEISKENEIWINGENYLEESPVSFLINTSSNVNLSKETPIKVLNQKDKYIRVRYDSLDNIINDATEIKLSKSGLEEIGKTNKKLLQDLKNSTERLQQIVKEISISAESQIKSKSETVENSADFDPLEFDKFTRLQELTRFMNEVILDINSFSENTAALNNQHEYRVNQQNLSANSLLNELTKIRLVSAETISDKLYKIVRNTAKELSKVISLELEGEKTELDKLILDRMFDPIAHLLRNCIFHGIESEKERVANGKSVTGKIKIKISLQGNNIVFVISDDGRGIDVNKLKKIAIDKKIIKDNYKLTKDELLNLIFVSGFSTVASVSEVAGRGVGMEIVQNEIYSLGGTIKINTEIGIGTNFICTIPVSTANSQAMICLNETQHIGFPTFLIDQLVSIKENDLKNFYQKGYIEVDKEKYNLYYIGYLMGGPILVSQLPEIKNYNNVLIINYNEEKIAVHVDGIVNTLDVVIRAANRHLSRIPGILGTTLFGDAKLGVIINPLLLVEYWKKKNKVIKWENDVDSLVEKKDIKIKEKNQILVIDDSITVRKSTEKVLVNAGFDVLLAKHGSEGLELLLQHNPDLILCDIEMPVMDGFDFLKNLRMNEKFNKIPIFMITSRTADKHKNYAMSLGANEFLGKPFQEKQLLNLIKNYVKEQN